MKKDYTSLRLVCTNCAAKWLTYAYIGRPSVCPHCGYDGCVFKLDIDWETIIS